MAKAAHHSFATFFKDFYNACKVDFSGVYANDRLTDMTKHFVAMSESLGIKVEKDKYGCFDVAEFDGEKSQRVQWAWDDFISDLRDDDLMDEAAAVLFVYSKIKDKITPVIESKAETILES